MLGILKLIRWKNLLLIALVQVLIKYALFEPFDVDVTLNGLGFSVLVIATLCLAAAGNVINDIIDVKADTVNKPNKVIVGKTVSEKLAYRLFFVLNIFGIGLGFYLAQAVGKNAFFGMFVIISAVLYIYSTYLKQLPIIGNLIVSILVAFSLVIVAIFDLLPVINTDNRVTQHTFFKIVLDYAYFAFIFNMIREMVKDIEDIEGDYKAQMSTLPIVLGRTRAGQIIFVLSLIPIPLISYYVYDLLYKQVLAVLYFLVFVIGPMIYISIKLFSAETKLQYRHISLLLKCVMLFGMLSMLIYPFILK